jgi:hypothetical protein
MFVPSLSWQNDDGIFGIKLASQKRDAFSSYLKPKRRVRHALLAGGERRNASAPELRRFDGPVTRMYVYIYRERERLINT